MFLKSWLTISKFQKGEANTECNEFQLVPRAQWSWWSLKHAVTADFNCCVRWQTKNILGLLACFGCPSWSDDDNPVSAICESCCGCRVQSMIHTVCHKQNRWSHKLEVASGLLRCFLVRRSSRSSSFCTLCWQSLRQVDHWIAVSSSCVRLRFFIRIFSWSLYRLFCPPTERQPRCSWSWSQAIFWYPDDMAKPSKVVLSNCSPHTDTVPHAKYFSVGHPVTPGYPQDAL